jgi:hypothetical protein
MGGDTNIEQPQQPSTGQSVSEWAQNLPQIYQTQMQYAPLQAAMQVQLANQYAGQYGQAMQKAQQGLYPETSKLQEQLATQASQGMNSNMPDWMKQQYQSNMNAQLGTNVNAPVGADYASRGLMQQQEDWRRYYQNLGLTTAGRQPLTMANTPGTSDYMSNFTPNAVMSSNNQNYGTSASMYNAQLQYPGMATPLGQTMNAVGQWGQLGGLGAQAGGGINAAMNGGGMSSLFAAFA